MEYRRMGKTGLKLSVLSLGSYATFGLKVGEQEAREMMALAYDHGVNFFDNAESYAAGESERVMGKALAQLGWSRDSYCVSSKVFWGGDRPTQVGLSRKHIYDACHGALSRMGVDYLDLFYCHRFDPETPLLEVVQSMSELVTQGKVRYWGTSEWPANKIHDALELARHYQLIGPTVEQTQYNLLNRHQVEAAYAPLIAQGYGLTTFSPLAGGLLTGKYAQEIPEGSRVNHPDFAYLRDHLATPAGKQQLDLANQWVASVKDQESPVQLAIAWCLCNPRVSSVLLGASSRAQLETALDSFQTYQSLKQSSNESLFLNMPVTSGVQKIKARLRYLWHDLMG